MSTIPTTFPVVHSVLGPQALQAEVAAHFALGEADSCVLLRSWINEVYQLQHRSARTHSIGLCDRQQFATSKRRQRLIIAGEVVRMLR
jgi:hypothetical protein